MPTAPPRLTVISLRPHGQHAGLRSAAARLGADLLALSPLAIAHRGDAATRGDLERALACPVVVFTSPNAVDAARALQPLAAKPGQAWLAVGSGTRRRLAGAGVVARAPQRMDSEGLLAMPELQAVAGLDVGLVAAPGGRGRIVPALQSAGARVRRADAYERVPHAIPARRWARLRQVLATPERVALALSSAEAFAALLVQLPADLQHPLRAVGVVAASARLAGLAGEAGFARVAQARNATPAAILQAAADAFV